MIRLGDGQLVASGEKGRYQTTPGAYGKNAFDDFQKAKQTYEKEYAKTILPEPLIPPSVRYTPQSTVTPTHQLVQEGLFNALGFAQKTLAAMSQGKARPNTAGSPANAINQSDVEAWMRQDVDTVDSTIYQCAALLTEEATDYILERDYQDQPPSVEERSQLEHDSLATIIGALERFFAGKIQPNEFANLNQRLNLPPHFDLKTIANEFMEYTAENYMQVLDRNRDHLIDIPEMAAYILLKDQGIPLVLQAVNNRLNTMDLQRQFTDVMTLRFLQNDFLALQQDWQDYAQNFQKTYQAKMPTPGNHLDGVITQADREFVDIATETIPDIIKQTLDSLLAQHRLRRNYKLFLQA